MKRSSGTTMKLLAMYNLTRSSFGMIALLASAIVFIAPSRLTAQDENIRVDTNLVLINVLVEDKDGKFVTGLTTGQFEIFDDKSKRPIEVFSAEKTGVSFGVVYDMHPTTDEGTKAVAESLRLFKSELLPTDDVFLVTFNREGKQVFEFIPTFEQIQRFMASPDSRDTRSLYDAVYFASEKMASSRNEKRVLLIISDSADDNSRHTFSDLRGKLLDVKAEAYAVVVGDSNEFGFTNLTHGDPRSRAFTSDATALDRAAMLDLTLQSGGSTYFGLSQNAAQLLRKYKQIANEMRSHYTLGFYPDVVDTKVHSIVVKLKNVKQSKGFTMSYRTSYQNRTKIQAPVSKPRNNE